MLNDLLERGARSCGFDLHWHNDGKLDITQAQLKLLAFFITSAEREACAAIADKYTCGTCGMDGKAGREIRERSNFKSERGEPR